MNGKHKLYNADAVRWANEYEGDLFHALFCDAPYEYGFMGKSWDSSGVSFQVETWEAYKSVLHPGAFGMAFGGARTVHRMTVAIEDAGFIIHPLMGWVYGSGFPKATRIKDQEIFEGHRYGKQAIKPALEPVIVFQKPYEVKPVESIIETGAGALNIDGGRIGTDDTRSKAYKMTSKGIEGGGFGTGGMDYDRIDMQAGSKSGRWPANFILVHSEGCKIMGYKEDNYSINRFTDGAKPFGDGAGHEFEAEDIDNKTPVWECVEGCAVRELDDQSGKLKSGTGAVKKASAKGTQGSVYGPESRSAGTPNIEYGDIGGASRFFYQAKASKAEREAGLNGFEIIQDGVHNLSSNACSNCGMRVNVNGSGKKCECGPDRVTVKININKNNHPTLKPIDLNKHLAALLLPPKEYAPRRLFVPFAGVGSEMIGALLAGWDEVTGVEITPEYIPIAKARIKYWTRQRRMF